VIFSEVSTDKDFIPNIIVSAKFLRETYGNSLPSKKEENKDYKTE
jgi:hypothetical protein